jgi:hypothetical protein
MQSSAHDSPEIAHTATDPERTSARSVGLTGYARPALDIDRRRPTFVHALHPDAPLPARDDRPPHRLLGPAREARISLSLRMDESVEACA